MIKAIVIVAFFAALGAATGATIALVSAALMRLCLPAIHQALALFLCAMPAPLLLAGSGIDAWRVMVTDTRNDVAPLGAAAFVIMTPAAAASAFVVAALLLRSKRRHGMWASASR